MVADAATWAGLVRAGDGGPSRPAPARDRGLRVCRGRRARGLIASRWAGGGSPVLRSLRDSGVVGAPRRPARRTLPALAPPRDGDRRLGRASPTRRPGSASGRGHLVARVLARPRGRARRRRSGTSSSTSRRCGTRRAPARRAGRRHQRAGRPPRPRGHQPHLVVAQRIRPLAPTGTSTPARSTPGSISGRSPTRTPCSSTRTVRPRGRRAQVERDVAHFVGSVRQRCDQPGRGERPAGTGGRGMTRSPGTGGTRAGLPRPDDPCAARCGRPSPPWSARSPRAMSRATSTSAPARGGRARTSRCGPSGGPRDRARERVAAAALAGPHPPRARPRRPAPARARPRPAPAHPVQRALERLGVPRHPRPVCGLRQPAGRPAPSRLPPWPSSSRTAAKACAEADRQARSDRTFPSRRPGPRPDRRRPGLPAPGHISLAGPDRPSPGCPR